MNTGRPETPIDAVRLVRRIRDAHHEALRGASRADRIAFYNDKLRARPAEPRRETERATR